MTDQELKDGIDWLFGGHDQGQRDDLLRDRVSKQLHNDDKQAMRVLGSYAMDILNRHTFEELASFIHFLDYHLGYSL